MKVKTVIITSVAAAAVGVAAVQSCTAIATSAIGVAVIKRVLLGGVSKGMKVFKNKNEFLQSPLIDSAMPSGLKKMNSVLGKISPDLVKKEKEYIAETASFTATIAEPILVDAVNSLTSDDVSRIMQGEAGTATQILREKTYNKLVSAFTPKVDEKLNEFGIVRAINNVTSANSMLGSLLGNEGGGTTSNSLSQYATEQMVTGLFYIIQDYEKENSQQFLGK